MIGNEGTLGIVVDAAVQLRLLGGREDRGIIGSFATLQDAGRAAAAVSADGIIPAVLT